MATLEVPEGEHISFVIGNFGWYVDNLVFISSSGRPLGNLSNSRKQSQNVLKLRQIIFLGLNDIIGHLCDVIDNIERKCN